MLEKVESYIEKISKADANIECCQNTNTLQQNIINLKNSYFLRMRSLQLL